MSLLLTTTGLALLVGTGSVSLPAPPAQSGGGEPPPDPPAEGAWYDEVFAKLASGTGPRVGSWTDAATWASGKPGVTVNATTATITASNMTITAVDFGGRKVTNSGNNNIFEDCLGEVSTNGQGGNGRQWSIGGNNPIVRYCRFTNPSFLGGVIMLAFHDATTTATEHNNQFFDWAGQDPLKGPSAGTILVSHDSLFKGCHLITGAHIDTIDFRLSEPGSSVKRAIIVGDKTATSVPSQTSTGYTNAVRQSPGDFGGAGGIGLTVEECICVGHDDPGAQSALFSIGSGDTTPGNRMYDLLVDLREHNSVLFPGIRIDDWYVRTFDYAASVTAGQVTGISAPVAYPHLATFPAQVPSQMAAPVLTVAPGGFVYAAMARPLNMRSLITSYTLEWSVNGSSWTAVAADLAGGFIPTGAQTNVRARVYATNGIGNSTVSPVSNILPTISAASVTLTSLPFDGFVFDAASTDSATAVLRGTTQAGAYVQARGEGTVNTAWVQTIADGAGNWAVALPVDANAGEWYTPAARISGDDTTKVTKSNKFAGGDVHVFAGQSEIEHILAVASFYNGNAYPTLLAQNLTMITKANTGSREIRRITTTGTGTVNVAMVALANLFHRARPGRKLLIIDCAVSGTSRSALHNDGDTTFNWSDLQASIDDIRGAGGEIGHWTECWYNADAATIKTFGTSWAPFYMGQRWGGGSFTLGTANPDDGKGPVDHCLWDVTAATDAYGRGAFKRDRTKLHLLTPMVFCDTATTEQRSFTHDASGNVLNNRIKNLDRPARDTLATFAADSRVQSFLAAIGPSAHVVDFGGGIHPLPDDPYGTPQFAMLFAPAVLRASGYTISEPVIDHAAVSRGAAGAYADIPVTLPNGGTLTTIRALRSIAAPGTEPPHYQPVVGFEIRRAADGDGGRRPVMKTTETGYPSAYRGTVTIQDAGSGSGSARRGVVRITPTDAFAAGDMLEYLRGEANGHILEPRDVTARLFLDMLIEHIPGLYNLSDTYPFHGVPVKPQPSLMVLT